mmetsp:Transcript_42381/g.57885  ORF Transcript_42381/g.57885 Transcript_42381/m.57885 type:complete len:135 (-) Transcript_42381:798-1202(-)
MPKVTKQSNQQQLQPPLVRQTRYTLKAAPCGKKQNESRTAHTLHAAPRGKKQNDTRTARIARFQGGGGGATYAGTTVTPHACMTRQHPTSTTAQLRSMCFSDAFYDPRRDEQQPNNLNVESSYGDFASASSFAD